MFTVQKIAELTGSRILSGDAGTQISGVSSFDDAGATDLTFAVDPKFLSRIEENPAGAILVPESFSPEPLPDRVYLVHPTPKIAFFKVVAAFFPKPEIPAGVHPSAVIGEQVHMGDGVAIGPNVCIGDHVTIGPDTHIMANTYIAEHSRIGCACEIKPNVTIMARSLIGDRGIIHPGAVIGSDGYGFAQSDGAHRKLIHTGYVEIGNDVEIGSCTTIDKGTLGVTRIGNGVKMDNQIHIAHNVKIGDHSLVVAQVGIAGSTRIGKGAILAGKAGISGHLNIGDNAIIGPYAGVVANVAPGDVVSGIPHMPHKTWLKVANIISRLPGMRTKLLSLERRINRIESKPTE